MVVIKGKDKKFNATTERTLDSDDFNTQDVNLDTNPHGYTKGTFDTVNNDYHSANVVAGSRKKWAPLSTRHKSFMNRRSVQQQSSSNVSAQDIKLQEI